MYLTNFSSVDINNVHLLSPWTWNTDGFAAQGNKVNIVNSFCLVNDNALFPEFINEGDYNVSRCVINGRAFSNVGYGYFSGLTAKANIKDIEMMYPEMTTLVPADPVYHQPVFEAVLDAVSSRITVENQYYENIMIPGDIDQLVHFLIKDTDWGAAGPAQGNMRNINFKNIEVAGKQRFKSVIRGKDSSNQIGDIRFVDLKINGVYVDESNYKEYFDIGPHTYNIKFSSTKPKAGASLSLGVDFSVACSWLEEAK
jgi:hypothetical protein